MYLQIKLYEHWTMNQLLGIWIFEFSSINEFSPVQIVMFTVAATHHLLLFWYDLQQAFSLLNSLTIAAMFFLAHNLFA